MKQCITSWDDGSPQDLRLSELLNKYDISATFYIPAYNREGRKTLLPSEIQYLGERFTIGAHTYNHVDLTTVTTAVALEEVRTGKEYLEDILGKEILDFCYPRGHFTKRIRDVVEQCGFTKARTARMMSSSEGEDPLLRHPQWHFYPHRPIMRALHTLKEHDMSALKAIFLLKGDLSQQSLEWHNQTRNSLNSFEIWGHSWEIDELNLWGTLEEYLALESSQRD